MCMYIWRESLRRKVTDLIVWELHPSIHPSIHDTTPIIGTHKRNQGLEPVVSLLHKMERTEYDGDDERK